VKGRRRRMRQRPWFLVRHVCLELRRLMPAGLPCQVGAGLLGLFASTFFRPFPSFFFFSASIPSSESRFFSRDCNLKHGFGGSQSLSATSDRSGGDGSRRRGSDKELLGGGDYLGSFESPRRLVWPCYRHVRSESNHVICTILCQD